VAFSADGKLFASGGMDGQVTVWDIAAGKFRSLPAPDPVSALAFNPAGDLLAVSQRRSDGPSGVSVWDLAAGRVRLAFPSHPTMPPPWHSAATAPAWPRPGGTGRFVSGTRRVAASCSACPQGKI